jgi:hypothetical protein
MFALIETNGATHIAIHIPHDGADKSIPALVGMLEHNATFIKKDWRRLNECKPEMTIHLGHNMKIENSDEEAVIGIPSSPCVLDDSFVQAGSVVLISNRKAIERKDQEIERLKTELAHVKQQLQDLQD